MRNIEHLCRICVRESQFFKHIFSQGLLGDSIVKIINALCELGIHEGDGLPQHICGECYEKLHEVQKFKMMCHDGSTALLSLKTKYSKVKREDVTLGKDPVKVEKSGCPRSRWNKASVENAVGEERMDPRGLEKEIAMNEVFIKTEPVDEVEEILPTGADDRDEVIIPEARGNAPGGSAPYHEVRVSQVMNSQRNPLEPDATDEETDQGNQAPKAPTLKESGGSGMLKVRSPQFLMKSGPVTGSQCHTGNKPPLEVKQKALILTDPIGQGNVLLRKMGPHKFLPLMLTKQSLILLQSPGNPGILQAAYVKPTNIVPTNLQQRVHPPLLGSSILPVPLPTSDGRQEGSGNDKLGEAKDSPPGLVDRDMGVSYLCKTVSSNHRPHVCETCGKCFRRSLHLRYHRSTHQDERPFSCAECGKSFKLKTILTTHMMTHSREPPRFGCDLCEKKFPTRARLKYHQVVHSSERNFECRECNKRYKTKNQLGVHLRTHLKREPPYPCPRCERRFKQLGGLQKHRARLNH